MPLSDITNKDLNQTERIYEINQLSTNPKTNSLGLTKKSSETGDINTSTSTRKNSMIALFNVMIVARRCLKAIKRASKETSTMNKRSWQDNTQKLAGVHHNSEKDLAFAQTLKLSHMGLMFFLPTILNTLDVSTRVLDLLNIPGNDQNSRMETLQKYIKDLGGPFIDGKVSTDQAKTQGDLPQATQKNEEGKLKYETTQQELQQTQASLEKLQDLTLQAIKTEGELYRTR